jgi:hypothetical protein
MDYDGELFASMVRDIQAVMDEVSKDETKLSMSRSKLECMEANLVSMLSKTGYYGYLRLDWELVRDTWGS